MIVGIFLNSVVIVCLRRSWQLRKKLCYFMIFVLSCFDLAVVMITHPALMVSTILMTFNNYDETRDHIIILICITFNGFSMIALLTLNIERFLALSYPFFHERNVTKKRLMYFIALLVCLAIAQTSLTFAHWITSDNILITVYFILFLFFFGFLNYKTLMIAKSKRCIGDTAGQQLARHRLNVRKTSTSFWAVVCFFVCFSPQIVYSIYHLAYKTPCYHMEDYVFHLWSSTFVSANSTLNCLVLFWRNTVLRREGTKTIKSCFGRNRSNFSFRRPVF